MTTSTEAEQRARRHALANRQQIELLRALLAEDADQLSDLTNPEPEHEEGDPEAALISSL
ncbi:hypothetical protein [uncultured Deinococcus sp.]|uniref:hypothetical protein n=1 Tax=uncultured Deinococcus sp. TaxID=158789 RepID=UPI0025ED378B|nr:hypothetical protein [uncultured Deinococcus sp.]